MTGVYGLEDTQAAMIGLFVGDQIREETLREHVPGLTADQWVDLKCELLPSELEQAYGVFLQLQQTRRMTVVADSSGGNGGGFND